MIIINILYKTEKNIRKGKKPKKVFLTLLNYIMVVM